MKQWLRIVSAFLLASLCWEVLTTFLSERRPARIVSPKLGLLGKPGLVIHGREGFSIGRINSRYCRGAEFDTDDASKRRVVVLGDSNTQGLEVAEAETYSQVAQQLFHANGREDVQMINAGHAAKSPPCYIATGKAWMDFLRSGFAVVQLDERDFTADFYDPSAEVYATRDGDSFSLVRKPLKQSKAALRAPCSSIALRLLRALEERNPAPSRQSKPPLPDPSFAQETLWFMREAKKTFPHVAVVYVPTMDYYQPETLSQLPPLEVSLERAAKAEGVPYVNARPQFAKYFLETNQPCHGFNNTKPGVGHPNGYGHRLIGEALYKLISPLLK